MVDYSPPPEDLSQLNPIQRYMQKGSLDRDDYVWLLILVLAYFSMRPTIQKVFKWWFSEKDVREGEQILNEYAQSKAKVGPNSIRGTESQDSTTIPTEIGETSASGSNVDKTGKVVNRKTRDTAGEAQLLDWDDEPARIPAEGDKTDVVAWLDKWSNE